MVSPITVTTVLNPNKEMTDFDYKKYSLENLENWMHDAISSAEATPQEIYDTIKNVVEEEYHYYKQNASRCDKLLTLLNRNDGWTYGEVIKEEEYYESSMPPWGHSDMEYLAHNKNDTIVFNTKEEVKSCGVGDTSEYCKNSWNDFWEKEDKVTKWVLPVQLDGLTGDCYINLPDDLLERAGLKEGDTVEWIERGGGSFEMRKVNGIK